MLRIFILLTSVIVYLSSCNFSPDKESENIPVSTGKLGEIVIVSDEGTLTAPVKESLRESLGELQTFISPPEPMFKLVFTPISLLKGYTRMHSSIIVLVHKGNVENLDYLLYGISDTVLKNRLNDTSSFAYFRNDVWARPQSVIYLFGKNPDDLQKKIVRKKDFLISKLNTLETKSAIEKLYPSNRSNDSISKKLMERYGYSIRVPSTYRHAIFEDDFSWLRFETKEYSMGIWSYSQPYKSQNAFSTEKILQKRDSICKKYIPGALPNTHMITYRDFPVTKEETSVNGNYAILLRGWWNVKNDFMGGPFINYTIYHEPSQRVITIEGFFYGPNLNKTEYLRQLKAVISTFAASNNSSVK